MPPRAISPSKSLETPAEIDGPASNPPPV